MSSRPTPSPGPVVTALAAGLVVSNLLGTAAVAAPTPEPPSPSGATTSATATLTAAARAVGPPVPRPMGPVPPAPLGPVLAGAARDAAATTTNRPRRDSAAATRSRRPLSTEATGRAALARLGYDVASTGFRVEFRAAREGLLGETFLDRRVIRIYVRPGQSVAQVVRILAHEVGHAVDVSSMTPRTRQRWLALRGASGTPWWPGQGRSDFASGAGDFAEVFARWLLGERMRFRSEVAPAPAPGQLAELAAGFFRPQARTA